MKILKPDWINHNDHSIFSIDVHPDSSRLATGGQGQDSGKIMIWNMAPVVCSEKECDENCPRVLCQMDHHIACVNVVRWSNNGLFLASGSDDKLIMIWQYVHSGPSYQNMENWKCGFTLRGHSGDVLDLAWSSKDQYLASCSVDNTVIIWNALKFPDIITRINAHAGLVKGVAWDPVHTFLASQSDDKTLKVWRTVDWCIEKCIDEPFKQCAGTTHVLRLNWSPDGQTLVSAHAINNGVPTAQAIDRGNKWNTKIDFVGHRKAVTAVRFFPLILKPAKVEGRSNNPKQGLSHCLCAIGSRDRSVSIWLTSYSRPLCVIYDLFDNPIMDLTWSKTPKPGLLACSMDGSIAFIEFDYTEVGYPFTRTETEEFFMKKYNYDINSSLKLSNFNNVNNNQSSNNLQQQHAAQPLKEKPKFVENVHVLLAQEKKEQQQQKQNQIILQNINENSVSQQSINFNTNSQTTPSKLHMLTENQKQIERRMPDGRRRITPICVSKPGEYDTPKPFDSTHHFNKVAIGFGIPNEAGLISKSATESSVIIVEKRDENGEIVEVSPVKSIVYTKQSSLSSGPVFTLNSNSSNDPSKNTQQQGPAATTMTTAVAVATTTVPIAQAIKPSNLIENKLVINEPVIITKQTNTANLAQQQQPQQKSQQVNSSAAIKQPSLSTNKTDQNQTTNLPSGPINNSKQKQQQQASTKSAQVQPAQLTNVEQKQKLVVPATTSIVSTLTAASTPTPAISVASPVVQSFAKTHSHHHIIHSELLSPLKIDKNYELKIICNKTPTRSGVSIEIHNSFNLNSKQGSEIQHPSHLNHQHDLEINFIKYLIDNKIKWQLYFSNRICDVVSSNYLVACVCSDSTLNIIRASTGSQLCCPILLDSRAALLKCNSNYCMCLTVNGKLYLWKYNYEQHDTAQQKYHLQQQQQQPDILKTLINQKSCESVLKDGIFLDALLTNNGIPVIYMSKNRSFFYSMQTECWHLVSQFDNLVDTNSSLSLINAKNIYSGGVLVNSGQDDVNVKMGPLDIIQSREKNTNTLKAIELMNKTSTSNSLFNKQDFTLTYLESQVNAAIGLNSAKEYKFWLLTFARYLIENNYEEKLTELCNFLLGPLYSSNWNQIICTFKKRELLKEILDIVAQNLIFQRLHSFYTNQLNQIVTNNASLNASNTVKNSLLFRLTSQTTQQNLLPLAATNIKEIPVDKTLCYLESKNQGELVTLTTKVNQTEIQDEAIQKSKKMKTDNIIEIESQSSLNDVKEQTIDDKQTSPPILQIPIAENLLISNKPVVENNVDEIINVNVATSEENNTRNEISNNSNTANNSANSKTEESIGAEKTCKSLTPPDAQFNETEMEIEQIQIQTQNITNLNELVNEVAATNVNINQDANNSDKIGETNPNYINEII